MAYLTKLHGSPLRMGSTVSRLQSYYEIIYSLALGPQGFLLMIWSKADVGKAEFTSEPNSKWKNSYIFTPRKQRKKLFMCIAEFGWTGYEFLDQDQEFGFPRLNSMLLWIWSEYVNVHYLLILSTLKVQHCFNKVDFLLKPCIDTFFCCLKMRYK